MLGRPSIQSALLPILGTRGLNLCAIKLQDPHPFTIRIHAKSNGNALETGGWIAVLGHLAQTSRGFPGSVICRRLRLSQHFYQRLIAGP